MLQPGLLMAVASHTKTERLIDSVLSIHMSQQGEIVLTQHLFPRRKNYMEINGLQSHPLESQDWRLFVGGHNRILSHTILLAKYLLFLAARGQSFVSEQNLDNENRLRVPE
jgi:hypothetical protein